MEEDEYDDELPPISVNSSNQDESVFAMPSAEVLASQRARAEECERKLQQLREQHELQEAALKADANTAPITPSRSNSSGSEGETMLATAVEALRVGSACAEPSPQPAAERASLLARMLAELPAGAGALCRAYVDALQAAAGDADALADDIITSIWSWVSGLSSESSVLNLEGEERGEGRDLPGDDEMLGVCAWLCVCVLCGQPAARARRALHAVLARASHQQVVGLARVLVPALGGARRLLCVCVCVGGVCAALTHALTRAALALLLAPPDGTDRQVSTEPLTTQEVCELVSLGWRLVPADERELALQLAGRALAAARRASDHEHQALARALATLAQPPTSAQSDRHRPDHLKIAVAASKLKILLSGTN